MAAHRAGLTHFGESYVQEALPKMDALASLAVTWHFVGKLQANKTRQVAERFALGPHRRPSANRRTLERAAPRVRRTAQCADPSQSRRRNAERRRAAADVAELARAIRQLPRLELRGLMTLPPQTATPAHWFAELAALRARLAGEGIALDTLVDGNVGRLRRSDRRGRHAGAHRHGPLRQPRLASRGVASCYLRRIDRVAADAKRADLSRHDAGRSLPADVSAALHHAVGAREPLQPAVAIRVQSHEPARRAGAARAAECRRARHADARGADRARNRRHLRRCCNSPACRCRCLSSLLYSLLG